MAATAEDMEEDLRDDQAIYYLCAEASSLAYKASARSEISEKCARFNLTDIKYSEVHHSYQGVAFRSEKHKVIIIAHKGTNPENFSDLINDANLAVGKNPRDYASAQEFSRKRRKWARTHHANYKIIETGHSLGAVYAELNAIEFVGEAITFESPGIKAIKQTLPSGCKITTYLAAPNPINTCNGHIGEIIRLYVPHIRKEDLSFNNPQEVMQALKSLYDLGIRFIANPQQVVVNGVLNLILNRLKSLPDQMKSYYLHQHSLDAMLNCFHDQRPSLQRKIREWPSLGEYLLNLPGFSTSFSNFISSRFPFASNYLKQCNVELEMKISSIGTFAAGEIVVIEKGEMKDSEYEDYGSRLLETYSMFYAGEKEFNSLKNQLGYNGELPKLVITDREEEDLMSATSKGIESGGIEISYDYKLIFLNGNTPLEEKDKEDCHTTGHPILIKRGDERFSVYGKVNESWSERGLHNLTGEQLDCLNQIDFHDRENSKIHHEDVDADSVLAKVLTRGHDQIGVEFQRLKRDLETIKQIAAKTGKVLGVTVLVAGTILVFCTTPAGLTTMLCIGGGTIVSSFAVQKGSIRVIDNYYATPVREKMIAAHEKYAELMQEKLLWKQRKLEAQSRIAEAQNQKIETHDRLLKEIVEWRNQVSRSEGLSSSSLSLTTPASVPALALAQSSSSSSSTMPASVPALALSSSSTTPRSGSKRKSEVLLSDSSLTLLSSNIQDKRARSTPQPSSSRTLKR